MPSRQGYKLFYKRRVGDHKMLVCLECERDSGDPATASKLSIVYEGDGIFVYCAMCTAKKRLIVDE